MRKKLLCSSVVVAASLFVSSANAAEIFVKMDPSWVYGDDTVPCALSAPCTFTRTFNFITPVGFNLASADIASTAVSAFTDINFSSVTLNGISFNIMGTGMFENRNLANQSLVSGANNSLIVMGTSGGGAAFQGGISFAQVPAIPEPATWMMMLLGFAGIGLTMRRKDKSTLQVRYT